MQFVTPKKTIRHDFSMLNFVKAKEGRFIIPEDELRLFSRVMGGGLVATDDVFIRRLGWLDWWLIRTYDWLGEIIRKRRKPIYR